MNESTENVPWRLYYHKCKVKKQVISLDPRMYENYTPGCVGFDVRCIFCKQDVFYCCDRRAAATGFREWDHRPP